MHIIIRDNGIMFYLYKTRNKQRHHDALSTHNHCHRCLFGGDFWMRQDCFSAKCQCQTFDKLCSLYSYSPKPTHWCTHFHKHEIFHCLNWVIIFDGEHQILFTPAGTRRNNNVFITSKRCRRRRFDVMKTLSLRHYCVMCPFGMLLATWNYQWEHMDPASLTP